MIRIWLIVGVVALIALFRFLAFLAAADAGNLAAQQRRLYSRLPLIGGWQRRAAAQWLIVRFERWREPSLAASLAEAVTRLQDRRVRDALGAALLNARDQPCVDAIWAVWAATRHAALTDMLLANKRQAAASPATLRVLTALKIGQIDLLRQEEAALIDGLVSACGDADPVISAAARDILFHLQRDESQEALCRFVIAHDSNVARAAALSAGYLPRDAAQRALFLFLTEQWARYEDLDFDRQLLSAARRAAAPDARQRIADTLRRAGRADFLTVLVGADYRSRAGDITDAEAEIMLHLLAEQAQWPKLWTLAFEISYARSLEIIRRLSASGWMPERDDERGLFATLRECAAAEIAMSPDEARRVLPLALPKATIRTAGRVNDLAFAPHRPVIAFGTGRRKAAVWNFQTGEVERIVSGFAHAVGLIAFAPDGKLLCAERAKTTAEPCAIYYLCGERLLPVGRHDGSVTALKMLDAERLLSAGRDEKAAIWHVGERRQISAQGLTFWPRAAAVSPDAQRALFTHRGAALYHLPDLERVRVWSSGSVGRCAVFLPGTESFVIGSANGKTYVFDSASAQPGVLLNAHDGRVLGAAVHAASHTLITAGSEGRLHFTDWQTRQLLGSLAHADKKFTALYASPDGAFFATGNQDDSMTLWDMRALDAPRLFTLPFAKTTPDQLAALQQFAGDSALPAAVRGALRFMQAVMRHRFRFAIEIGDIPDIKVGEFDIEIE